jgi:extradiol dioxygenase family protein
MRLAAARETRGVPPILHLSLPVRDLASSKAFYVDVLGCGLGREREHFIDVWFYGMQLTLHERPDQLLPADAGGVRHFGVALDSDELRALLERLATHPIDWLDEVSTDYPGTPREQTKAKLIDPSGNVIELKTYVDPVAAFDHTI